MLSNSRGPEALRGKIVIDTMNYYLQRDDNMAELDDESTTSSALHAAHLRDDVHRGCASSLQGKRDLLCDGLAAAGLQVARPAGTCFVVADAAPLGASDALDFGRRMPGLCGVVGVPVSVFCDDKDAVRTLVRFAFCKRDDVLTEAVARLGTLAAH